MERKCIHDFGRLPKSNGNEVISVNAKRTTLHHCLTPDHEDIALQITEVQQLKLLSHEMDTSVWLARSAKSDRILAVEGRLHDETSILPKLRRLYTSDE